MPDTRTLLQRIDSLHDAVDHYLEKQHEMDAGENALDMLALIKQAANADKNTMDGQVGNMTIRSLFGDEMRDMRKEQGHG